MKMSRCMGFRKCGDRMKTVMITMTPTAESAEAVRVTASSCRDWAAVRATSARGSSMPLVLWALWLGRCCRRCRGS